MIRRLSLGMVPLFLLLLTSALPVTSARAVTCTPTGFFRDAINMTAAQINPVGTVTGNVDATGCNIGVYYDNGTHAVSHAQIHGANYFGILVNGDVNNVRVNITDSRIYQIGEVPFNGTQHGVGIYYRAFGTGTTQGRIDGNQVSLYQKGGIVANGVGTAVDVKDNTVIGLGPVPFIAQNGIQIGFGAKGSVKNNTVSGNSYTGSNLASSGGILVVGGPCYGLPDYTVGTQIVNNVLRGNDVGVYLSNLDGSCNAPATPTNVNAVNNDIRNDAVTNTTGNITGPYQAGVSDQGNGDRIIGNTICGAGYDPANQPAGGYVNWIDVSATLNASVHGNHLGCNGHDDNDNDHGHDDGHHQAPNHEGKDD